MSEILVVGSLAYDSVKTPAGKVDRALGGSANYFSLAASLYSKVRVVGVVGEDYAQSDIDLLAGRQVDVSGMQKVKGKTFHWSGSYEGAMNEAKTHATELNVFESFNPVLPEHYKSSEFVFLANIAPELQLQVLEQVKKPLFVGMDTMNFWISIKVEALKKVLAKVDVVLINEGEAMMLTGAPNAISAAPKLVELGPKALVIKRGEYGFVLYTKDEGFFVLPAFPIETVIDPTGAGDTFAGGFFGYLSSLNRAPQTKDLKQACIQGSMLASFTIQDFSVKALAKVQLSDIQGRLEKYKKVITL
jgi:sugar/nucleoside kinase (ribokinase family)